MRSCGPFVLLLVLVIGAAVTHGQTAPPETAYRVGAGDVLKVEAYSHAEISGTFAVEENGDITFPILGRLAVVGLTATVAPDGIPVPPSVLSFDLPVMVAVTVIALPIVLTGFVVRRWEGALLLAYYAAYLAYVVLDATGRPTEAFSEVMLTFVIPATALGLGLAAWVELRRIRPGPAAPPGQAGPGGADPPGS